MSSTTTSAQDDTPFTIGLVGVCGAGKSELARRLRRRGYHVRHIAQEHSFSPTMYRRRRTPDILIYLHATFPTTIERKGFHWHESEYQEQLRRLEHARQHADLVIHTDALTPEEVEAAALAFLEGIDEE